MRVYSVSKKAETRSARQRRFRCDPSATCSVEPSATYSVHRPTRIHGILRTAAEGLARPDRHPALPSTRRECIICATGAAAPDSRAATRTQWEITAPQYTSVDGGRVEHPVLAAAVADAAARGRVSRAGGASQPEHRSVSCTLRQAPRPRRIRHACHVTIPRVRGRPPERRRPLVGIGGHSASGRPEYRTAPASAPWPPPPRSSCACVDRKVV